MKVHHHVVTEFEARKRIDSILVQLTNKSRQKMQLWIKEGLVNVNGRTVKSSYKCELNDKIVWEEKEEEMKEIIPENIPLDIVYEDEDIIIINKKKGMLTHPAQNTYQNTLVNALLYHTTSLSNLSGGDRLGIVHRLDKDTSGIMVIAKHNDAHEHLVNQFKARTVERKYEAIVHGVVQGDNGIIKAPIGRNPNNRQNMTVIESGKEAETHFSVIKHYNDFTHVKCELKTGRTHQIRVHMKYIGHPLVGDTKYGVRRAKKLDGHLLYAKKIGFVHPTKNEWVTFTVDCPTQFGKYLQRLEKTT